MALMETQGPDKTKGLRDQLLIASRSKEFKSNFFYFLSQWIEVLFFYD